VCKRWDTLVFQSPQLINFIGTALDSEDGTLRDSAYSWSSNRDGNLGQGHNLRLQKLSAGQHTIRLTARDSAGNISQDSIMINVLEKPNRQPIANSGPDQTVHVGTEVVLDGRASFDPDGEPLSFSWRFISAPDNAVGPNTLRDSTSATPHFRARAIGKYVLELVVRDGKVNSFPSQIEIMAVEG
jgi:hypothetical protein